jgi:3-oxoacyl-[acyl-carrier protein] reductase
MAIQRTGGNKRKREEGDMISLDFSGKTVLVVGGSSGIGNAAAQVFRKAGAAVHVTGTRNSASDYTADDSDFTGLAYYQLNVGDGASVETFAPALDRLDVLVNAAGTVLYGRREFAMEGFRHVMDVNINGLFQLCEKFRPLLRETKGAIVNIGSVASFRAAMGNPAYSASKGAVLTLTKTLAQAYAADNIRVNMVAPGFVATKLTAVTRESEARYAQSLQFIPMRRWGEARELGHAIAFLASPLASYITGESLTVDGGQST